VLSAPLWPGRRQKFQLAGWCTATDANAANAAAAAAAAAAAFAHDVANLNFWPVTGSSLRAAQTTSHDKSVEHNSIDVETDRAGARRVYRGSTVKSDSEVDGLGLSPCRNRHFYLVLRVPGCSRLSIRSSLSICCLFSPELAVLNRHAHKKKYNQKLRANYSV
jgi:hypothetical protein